MAFPTSAPSSEAAAPGTEFEQRKRVLEAQKVFQDELRTWRKMTQKPPLFLRDGQAKPLRPEALETCRVFASREDLVRTFLSGGIGAEIGVQHGRFSTFLLDNVRPERLHLFDMSKRLIAQSVVDDPRTELHVGDSSTNLSRLPDQHFDWIYIDGDHRLDGVRKDTEAAMRKIKPGGYLVFNDYTPWSIGEAMPYGVMTVVNDVVNSGLPVVGLGLASHGYFDIALQA